MTTDERRRLLKVLIRDMDADEPTVAQLVKTSDGDLLGLLRTIAVGLELPEIPETDEDLLTKFLAAAEGEES